MAIVFDITDRIIIPRWREFNLCSISNEHLPASSTKTTFDLTGNEFIQRKIHEWGCEAGVESAWELVNAAYVISNYKIAEEAAHYLRNTIKDMPLVLRKMVSEILGEPNESMSPIEGAQTSIDSLVKIVGNKIRTLKRLLNRQPRNEIHWIELSRLYSIIGNLDKAGKCVRVALQLADGYNRYILRSASRFYYHLGDFEKAQSVIRSSQNLKDDPWLLSAEISYASKMGRYSKNIKTSLALVNSDKFTNAATSELSGMLGTIEFHNGANKSAKKLTNKSLIAPNDNSLAQAEWIATQISDIQIGHWLNDTEFAFEAKAFEYFRDQKFEQAFEQGVDWFIDQPFSKRAIHFLSYVATVHWPNFQIAIEACLVSLKSNFGNFAIINNLIFALASVGRFSEADKRLVDLRSAVNSNQNEVVLLATEAYVLYRKKNYVLGKEKYLLALNVAKTYGLGNLSAVAECYFLREQLLAKELSYDLVKDALLGFLKHEHDFDIYVQIKAIIKSIEKTSASYKNSLKP